MAKVWLVTGASSGFGEALVKAIIDNGDSVAATFRKGEQLSQFEQQYPNALGVLMDVTHAAEVTEGIQKTIEKFGRIDVLVNNAGYGTIGAIEEFSMQEIRDQMETNYFGAVQVTKEVLPHMRAQGGGHILQISSAAGFKATGGFGVYNASKFALEGFSEALAQEVSPFNIKVVIVQPGPFRTKFASSSVKLAQLRLDEYKQTPVAQMYHYISRVDGRQEGNPEKGAKAMIDYVHNNNSALRLPLGKHAIDTIKAKLAAVQKDVDANEAITLSVMY